MWNLKKMLIVYKFMNKIKKKDENEHEYIEKGRNMSGVNLEGHTYSVFLDT